MRLVLLLLAVMLMTSGCADQQIFSASERYEASFLTLFDTVTTIIGYAESEEAFRKTAEQLHSELLEYHQLFDIYSDYPDINNLKTVNDHAGISPVKVDARIIDLLLFCRQAYDDTNGLVNAAMGSVLSLWHEARTASSALPSTDALRDAALHTDFDSVIIDSSASTVYLADPSMRLDVGAIAKGYAAQKICENAPSGLLISIGGNVCATGSKPASDTPWVVGLENPDGGEEYLHTLYLSQGSVVTSGDYQRYYTVDGKRYHHIIHPDTLMPYDRWRCVTVVCGDSAIADMLSTALFLMPYEDGLKLLGAYGAEAMWVDPRGNELFSEGFSESIKT